MISNKATERKAFIRDHHSKHWITKLEKGRSSYANYDICFVNLLSQLLADNSKILDVGVGIGAIAKLFNKPNLAIHGIDISSNLVGKCRQDHPHITAIAGDAESLPYRDNCFDCTYCIHVSWYFHNLMKSIDELLRVTSSNGFVIFDIQNTKNPSIFKNVRRRTSLVKGSMLLLKNLVKLTVGKPIARWRKIIDITPSNPDELVDYFRTKALNYEILVRETDGSITWLDNYADIKNYPRVIFKVSLS